MDLWAGINQRTWAAVTATRRAVLAGSLYPCGEYVMAVASWVGRVVDVVSCQRGR
jgi:hypothetical protein